LGKSVPGPAAVTTWQQPGLPQALVKYAIPVTGEAPAPDVDDELAEDDDE
jgi:hypothetical protein